MLNLADRSTMPVISVLVFVSVLLLCVAGYQLWRSRRGTAAVRLQRRLAQVARAGEGERSLLKQRQLSEVSAIARLLSSVAVAARLERLIEQAGLSWTVASVTLTGAAAGALGLAFVILTAQPALFGLLAGAVLASLPWMYVMWKRNRRMRRLEQQLPEALDLITRAVRAGHALPLAIQLLSEEMPDPIASEFRMVHEQVSFGISLQQALTGLCERVPLTDMRYFAVSILIQRQSGGNLTEVLGNLSKLIRERLKLLARVRVLSSEGRMSAWTLALLPFVLGGLMYLANPDFMRPLWTDPIGVSIIQTLLTMMLFGIILLTRLVKIRV
jgi:tight adherence protein B